MLATAIVVLALCLLGGAALVARAVERSSTALARPRDAAAVAKLVERHAPELRREVLAEARAFVADREQRLARLDRRIDVLERDLAEREARKVHKLRKAAG